MKILLGALALFAFSSLAWADADIGGCLKAFKDKNYADAFVNCEKIQSACDDPQVAEALGFMYLFGKGTLRDYRRAVELYQRASSLGSGKASFSLSQIYRDGIGIKPDLPLANFYEHTAVHQGYIPAVISSVERHYQANPRDNSPIAQYDFKLLMENTGDSHEAEFLLAECYRTGYGTEVDLDHAIRLYEKSSDPRSKIRTGEALQAKGLLDQAALYYQQVADSSETYAPEAYYHLGLLRHDQSLLEKSVMLGFRDAQVALGKLLISLGDSNDTAAWFKAEKYLLDACNRGDDQGCLLASWVYFKHLPADETKTSSYLMRLLELSSGEAFDLLAHEYLRGGHLSKDSAKALRLFETAYRQGGLKDYVALAQLYRKNGDSGNFHRICEEAIELGDNVDCKALLAYERLKSDPLAALEQLTQAYDLGSAEAAFLLYQAYSRGYGVDRDSMRSQKFLEAAVQRGSTVAMARMFGYYLEHKNQEQALNLANQVVKESPALGHEMLGRVYLKMEPRDYAKALEHFNLAWKGGEDRSLLSLGNIYEQGLGTPRDLFKACSFYHKASERKIKFATFALSRCLSQIHEGDGRSLIPYIEQAANDGDVDSIQKLIAIYSDDDTGSRNDRELVRWVTIGARLGMMDCLYRLGDLYMQGLRDILDRDEPKAVKYLTLAMDKGSSSAAWSLANYFDQKNRHREACDIYEKFSANQDYTFELNFAMCYLNGHGRPQDPIKGEALLQDAYSKNQSSEVAYLLGQTYSDETSPLYNLSKAAEWYIDAVDLGDTAALFNLATLYEKSSPEYNMDKAFHFYSKAMETGNMAAQLKVAQAYMDGRGVEMNPAKGCDLAQEAVNYSIIDANPLLARCYLTGKGREKNFDKAVALLHDGSDNNNTQSSLMLAELYSSGTHVDPDVSFACLYYYKAVLSSQTVTELNEGASFFLPGKLCYRPDDHTYVVLSMLSRKLNTSRYSHDLLKIRAELKDKERRTADELLNRYSSSDDEEDDDE